jgi:hypothetical protein
MVKLLVLALSVCAATLAGSHAQRNFASVLQEGKSSGAHDNQGGGPSLTETGLLAFPVITQGEIEGFFFLRLAYAVDAAQSRMPVPDELLLADGFHIFSANHPAYRQPDLQKIDIDGVADGVKAAVNAVAGAPLLAEVYITQLDYFASADVRKKSIERRLALKEPAKQAAPANTHGAPAH